MPQKTRRGSKRPIKLSGSFENLENRLAREWREQQQAPQQAHACDDPECVLPPWECNILNQGDSA
jgi:hypothetical protein